MFFLKFEMLLDLMTIEFTDTGKWIEFFSMKCSPEFIPVKYISVFIIVWRLEITGIFCGTFDNDIFFELILI